jgi:hypothetical protein
MHSTHDVFCRKCGKNLAFWSGFGDNMQFADEYQCQGKVWKKHVGYWQGLNSSRKRIWSGNFKPTKRYLKEEGMRLVKEIKPFTKEKWPCYIEHETYFCKDCAKELKYKCPKCKGEIKLTRKR